MNFKTMKRSTIVFFGLTSPLLAGSFAPRAGVDGSDAIPLDDNRIVAWATTVEDYQPGEEVIEAWQDTSQVLGPAEGTSFGVCALGRGGEITVSFGRAIPNGEGPDFAVFENSFSPTFLELAFVEVSSDGEHFFRFPNRSLTLSRGLVEAMDINGLAGKYEQGYGTPFDLADLPDSPLLNKGAVTQVRLIDIVSGTVEDSEGSLIFDPFPTVISAGFDCDAIALLEQPQIQILGTEIVEDALRLQWAAELGVEYRISETEDLSGEEWSEFTTILADESIEEIAIPLVAGATRFFRIEAIQ